MCLRGRVACSSVLIPPVPHFAHKYGRFYSDEDNPCEPQIYDVHQRKMWGLFLSLLGWMNISPVPVLADLIGTTEPALKLILSIIMGYPIALIYHKYIKDQKVKKYRNIYFAVTGIDMAFYNFGMTLYHNAVPAIVMYVSTMVVGPGKMHAIITFAFNVTYLLTGYILTESENYDITWTMPHCVLTLKMIALSFDLWDGKRVQEGLPVSDTNKKTALKNPPTFLELIGFIYFPSCFLVGPIFSFQRYSAFVHDKFPVDNFNTYETQAFRRFYQGILYLATFQVGVSFFNVQYMLSDEFWETSIFYRHIYCGIWGHFTLYKYIACWLLTEASCIRFGLSYNGIEKGADGEAVSKWDGCNNIKLLEFEAATKFQHYIDSFNCNTNHFAAEYVYKRLKFLGNRNLSQFFTLLFLALWHGTRSGYYMTFFNEFIIIYMEKDLESTISRTKLYRSVWSMPTKYLLYALLKMYTIVFMGWSLVPFDVKVFSKWWSIYSSLYFSGFILFLPWAFVYKPIIIHLKNIFDSDDLSPKTTSLRKKIETDSTEPNTSLDKIDGADSVSNLVNKYNRAKNTNEQPNLKLN